MNTIQEKNGQSLSNPAAITTTQPSALVFDKLPVSDYLWDRLNLKLDSSVTLTGASGTVVDRGALLNLRSINFETDKHGLIVNGLDGLALEHIMALHDKVRPTATDLTAATNATYATAHRLEIPFMDHDAARPEDTALDVLNARPTLTIQQGIASDFSATSTNSVDSGVTIASVELDPKAGKTAADMPLLMPYYFVHKEVISAAASQYKISLPYGDRIYKRIILAQRSTTAPFAPLANTVLGATGTYSTGGDVTLMLNGFPWRDRVNFLELQRRHLSRYGFAAPTGTAVLDFVPRFSRGFKYSDALNCMTQNTGSLDLLLDVAAPGTCAVWVICECLKNIPAGAVRQLPMQGA